MHEWQQLNGELEYWFLMENHTSYIPSNDHVKRKTGRIFQQKTGRNETNDTDQIMPNQEIRSVQFWYETMTLILEWMLNFYGKTWRKVIIVDYWVCFFQIMYACLDLSNFDFMNLFATVLTSNNLQQVTNSWQQRINIIFRKNKNRYNNS